jgi:hypothetical protein
MPQKKIHSARSRSKKYSGISVTPPHPLAWAITRNHVYPINDLRRHSLRECWCRPFDDEGLTIHTSLDGRELYETGERSVS